MSSSSRGYKAYSRRQMKKLLYKAKQYCNGYMVRCKWLYRNKEKNYFDDLFRRNRGIMVPIMKDGSGDPRSFINGQLEGVFFTASVKKGSKNGEPLEHSAYGPSRFLVDIAYLIDPDICNLYFADFYCLGNDNHYIILVIAEVDSEADNLCYSNLPQLDWYDNAFLEISKHFYVTDSDSCVVEVFYANDVNMKKALRERRAYLYHDISTHRRNPEVYKNLDCLTCNAFPASQNRMQFLPALKPNQSNNAYCMNQMNELLRKAGRYCDGYMARCNVLYKNRPQDYFDEIFQRKKGIMKPVMKDRGGDPRNPINNKLEAVFFTASVKRDSIDGEPIEKSPYGSSRFQASIDYLIDPDNFNLYFADFYCSGSDFHYISLVVAEVDSEADDICYDNLPLLKWDCNDFLTCDYYNVFEVADCDNCIIQVFYANIVNMRKALKTRKAQLWHEKNTLGKGFLRHEGMDKNLECSTCNFSKRSQTRRRR